MAQPLKQVIIVIALIAMVVLSATGLVDRALNRCGLERLSVANQGYLQSAFDKSLTGFLLLSSIKSGLAIVEGSGVGVGFNLEIGDVVQPVYDYVDIAWKAALAGGTIIVGMQLALKALGLADHWVLSVLMLVLAAQVLSRWLLPKCPGLDRALKEAVRLAATLCLTVYLLLPLSVTAASILSLHITKPMIEASHDQLMEIRDSISPQHINREIMSELTTDSLSGANLKTRLAAAKIGVQKMLAFLRTETDRIAALTIKLIAAYLFDCIVFPLLFGLVLITTVKSSVSYFFDINPRAGPTL